VGGGGNLLLAIRETGIGGETGAEFDKISGGAGLDFDGPGSFAGVIEKVWAEGVGALDNFENRSALVSLGDEFETVADGSVREGLEEPAAEGGGDEEGEGFGHLPGLGQSSEKKGGGGKTAEGVKVIEAEGSGGGKGQETGTDFHDAEFYSCILDLAGEDGLKAGAAPEVEADFGPFGERGLEADGGGFLLAGKIRLGPLFAELGESGSLGADEVERGGATDFIEGLADEFFFPIHMGFLEEGEKFAFFCSSRTDFWKGGHGIAANFFGGIVEEGEEPLADGFLQGGLVGLGKAGSDGADDRHAAGFFFRGGLLESGGFLLPKAKPRDRSEFLIELLGGVRGLLCHGRASVSRGGNSSFAVSPSLRNPEEKKRKEFLP